MLIRAEQMNVFAAAAEDNFARRLAAHLVENYGTAMVRLPDSEATIGVLPAEKLRSLVEISIERARRYNLTLESSISAFSALMFEVAPNFDRHRLSQVMLGDENVEPDARLDELLEVLTEKNWETIRAEYDVNAWSPAAGEEAKPANDAENSEPTENAAAFKTKETAKPVVGIDDIRFGETMVNPSGAKSEPDLLKTVPNFTVPKE